MSSYKKPNEYNKEIKIAGKIGNYYYFCDAKHPLVNSKGWIYYHRHIASIKLGRWILPNEQVHHIDKNTTNNSLDNLEILSKSDHSKITALQRNLNLHSTTYCSICKKELNSDTTKTNLCSKCYRLSTRKFNPAKEELEKLIWEFPMTKIGKMFGVTGKAIDKRCKLLGIKKPPRNYWQKHNAKKV